MADGLRFFTCLQMGARNSAVGRQAAAGRERRADADDACFRSVARDDSKFFALWHHARNLSNHLPYLGYDFNQIIWAGKGASLAREMASQVDRDWPYI